MSNYFTELYQVDVSAYTEKKNGLTYLAWARAWAEVKQKHPDATYTIYENKDGWNYHTDGKTCWVKTGVTIGDIEHIEYLPVMDYKNRSIPFENVTSFDVNKAIQRSLTKACARHGLGLYIYAGEDLPEEQTKTTTLATPKQVEILSKAYTGENLLKLLAYNNISKIEELPAQKASELIAKLQRMSNND